MNYWCSDGTESGFFEIQTRKNHIQNQTWVKADMMLGNARTNCRGSGLCQISVRGSSSASLHCKVIPVWLNKINSRCLQLIIDKRLLSKEDRLFHFAAKEVVLSKDIKLPTRISYSLGFERTTFLLAKSYALYQDGCYFHHFLDCFEQ